MRNNPDYIDPLAPSDPPAPKGGLHVKAEPEPPPEPPVAPQEVLQTKGSIHGIDPATLQLLMQMNAAMVRDIVTELRKPTDEEQKKLDAERKRQQNRAMQAAEQGRIIADMEARNQSACQHTKPNGQHTWRGQTHSDGWAYIFCIRCQKRYKVWPTPEMVSQGMNLDQIRGLTEAHLHQWAQGSAAMAHNQAQLQEQMAAASRAVNFNPTAMPPR